MDIKELLTALLAQAYKMPTEEITELLSKTDGKEALDAVLEKDKERIKTRFQDGFKAAKKEVMNDFEKAVRTEYGITDTNTQGLDLIKGLVSSKVEEAEIAAGKGGSKDITEGDIKKSKVYQDMEQTLKGQKEAVETEWKKKYDERESQYTKESRFNTVKDKALNILSGLPLAMPANTTIANSLKGVFANDLAGYDYEMQGDRIVVIKDGKPLEDAHGHTRSFEDLVKERAALYFEPKQNNGGSNAGNNNSAEGNGGNGSSATDAPKTEAEVYAKANDRSIPIEQREKMLADWEASQK